MVTSVLNTWEWITTCKDGEGERESYTTKGEHQYINNSGTSPNNRNKKPASSLVLAKSSRNSPPKR